MPFALLGFSIATKSSNGSLSWWSLLLVVLCMVFARSAAMAFNRFLDREFDAKNPRTAVREIPAGQISPKSALAFTAINAALFILTTWFINRSCFYLSGVALLVVLGYSYTKRFTPLCHFVLGLGLALAPVGAYLAVANAFHLIPILFGVVVLLWVSGFDIIYALQDEEFDREHQLSSMPAFLGKAKALSLSNVLHFFCGSLVVATVWLTVQRYPEMGQGWLSGVGVVAFCALLFYQHSLVKPNDLRKVNLAFFTTNGIASVLFCGVLILDQWI